MEPEAAISISHFAHVMQRYRGVILLALASVALLYAIFAVFAYLYTPARRIVMQRFRLDFEGAGEGEYPNGTNFSIADVVSGPILVRVFKENQLSDYLGFGEFSRSIFVLESNKQYEDLAAEYQARLYDPKLSAVDRERIEKEFELKGQSIAKNEYAIHMMQPTRAVRMPDTVARKVLLDTLNTWADFVVNQQHVTSYKVSVLTPAILQPSDGEQHNPVAAIQTLRNKANRVIANIEVLKQLPSANLVRTPDDRVSLEEVRLRVEEIVRFRLEPLVSVARASGGIADSAATLRFLENQLAFDERQLEAARQVVEATRYSLAAYDQPSSAVEKTTGATPSPAAGEGRTAQGGDAVVPQLSDSFLDRLIALTGRASDIHYRQKLVEDYRRAVSGTIPLQQAVTYDKQVLQEARTPLARTADARSVQAEVERARSDLAGLMGKTNELFQIINRNMTPSAQLFTLTDPPATRILRSVSPQRFGLYGVLTILVSLPVIVALCLLHNRIREENAREAAQHQATA